MMSKRNKNTTHIRLLLPKVRIIEQSCRLHSSYGWRTKKKEQNIKKHHNTHTTRNIKPKTKCTTTNAPIYTHTFVNKEKEN